MSIVDVRATDVTGPFDRTSLDDPDVPTPAVGSWPTIELPALGWLFVLAAIVDAVLRIRSFDLALSVIPLESLHVVSAAAALLAPAALLYRAPQAARVRRLLLVGLIVSAALEASSVLLSPLGLNAGPDMRSLLREVSSPLTGLAAVLVGLGLARLRAGSTSHRVLIAIAAIYVGARLLSLAIDVMVGVNISIDAYLLSAAVLLPLASAYQVSVSVDAWRSHEPARPFWALLAVALPASLAVVPIGLLGQFVGSVSRTNALFIPVATLDAFAAAVVGVASLIAFGWALPRSVDHR